jgi:hypothetical protein
MKLSDKLSIDSIDYGSQGNAVLGNNAIGKLNSLELISRNNGSISLNPELAKLL